jgi:GST-like protein
MIDLYLAPTANGLRAAVALEEAGLSYRAHMVDLGKGEQRSPEFLKLNPAGLIPVIVDDDGPGGNPLTLSQSGAIVLYSAEKSGSCFRDEGALSPCNG